MTRSHIYLSLIFTALYLGACSNISENHNFEPDSPINKARLLGLNGKVKDLSEKRTEISSGDSILRGDSTFFRDTYKFRKNGQVLLEVNYQNEAVFNRKKYSYDSLDRETGFEFQNILLQTSGAKKNRFNANGKLEKSEKFNQEGLIVAKSKYNYNFELKKREIEMLFFDGSNDKTPSEQIRLKYQYGQDGSLEVQERFRGGVRVHRKIFTGGKCTTGETYDLDGEVKEKEVYEYGEQGKVILYSKFGYENRLKRRMEYEYNSEGEKSRQVIFEKGIKDKETHYTYNGFGDLLKETEFYYTSTEESGADSVWLKIQKTFQIEYDSQGNWTNKQVIQNGKPIFEYERVITYWD